MRMYWLFSGSLRNRMKSDMEDMVRDTCVSVHSSLTFMLSLQLCSPCNLFLICRYVVIWGHCPLWVWYSPIFSLRHLIVCILLGILRMVLNAPLHLFSCILAFHVLAVICLFPNLRSNWTASPVCHPIIMIGSLCMFDDILDFYFYSWFKSSSVSCALVCNLLDVGQVSYPEFALMWMFYVLSMPSRFLFQHTWRFCFHDPVQLLPLVSFGPSCLLSPLLVSSSWPANLNT